MFSVFFVCEGQPRDLHVLTNPFPERRASDLRWRRSRARCARGCCTERRRIDGLLWERLQPRALAVAPPPAKAGEEAAPTKACRFGPAIWRSAEHTSELQSLLRHSYAFFCLKKKH